MDTHPPSKRVLIADDYPDVADMLATLISAVAPFEVEVATCENGAEALERALERRHDCLILDIDMPVMSGLAAAAAIRSALGPQAPLLIALTGDPRHKVSPDALNLDHFLMKPADIDRLIELIGSAPRRG